MKHLNETILLHYILKEENTSDTTIPDHIAVCSSCKEKYNLLKGLEKNMGNALNELQTEQTQETGSPCIDDITLADLIEGRLPEEESVRVREHVDGCNSCLQSLAFYYKSSKRMKSASAEVSTPSSSLLMKKAVRKLLEADDNPPFWDTVKELILRYSPFNYPVPYYVTGAVIIVFLALNIFKKQSGIIMIENSQTIIISKKGKDAPSSSFGFMGDSSEITKEQYSGMKVIGEIKNPVFEWKRMSGAKEYIFELIELAPKGEGKTVYSETTEQYRVELPENRMQKNRRYRWRLSGSLEDGKVFRAEGEVVGF